MKHRKSIATLFAPATNTGLIFSYIFMIEGCSRFCMKWFIGHDCIVLFIGVYSLITVVLNRRKEYSLFELFSSIITVVIAIISLFMIMMAKPV